MQHRAPVLGIDIIEPGNGPLTAKTAQNHHSHQLVITTEEQIKGNFEFWLSDHFLSENRLIFEKIYSLRFTAIKVDL